MQIIRFGYPLKRMRAWRTSTFPDPAGTPTITFFPAQQGSICPQRAEERADDKETQG
jgi:hypothetical protein